MGKKRKPMSQGTKDKIRETKIGNKNPMKRKEVQEKSSRSHLGKKLTKETIEKLSKIRKGRKRQPFSKEWRENMSKGMLGRKISQKCIEINRQRMLNGGADYLNSFPKFGYKNHKEWMQNGGGAYILRFSKNPSKEELELRKICQKILPYIEIQYPVYKVGKGKKSYNIDIAVPKLDLAIEFDGYFHFCDQEHINYHKRRQQEIEEDGWKFLRYDVFHPFPTLEQVNQDVQNLLNI